VSHSVPSLLDDPSALIGRSLIDRYAVESIIAAGGMSVVYRGRDLRLDRPVAIKVFAELFTGRAARVSYQHFVQEAFALSRLNHPHTIRIYDFAVIDEGPTPIPFQVSEYMDGGTLGDLIKKTGAQAPREARSIIDCIGGAVSEAHAQGIIHRDIKPSNILFGSAGKQRIVKLADFSVAQARHDASAAAARTLGDRTIIDHASFWSLGWSPPEQLRGAHVGHQADIYGLGLMLAYMLAGKPVWANQQPSDLLREPAALDGLLEEKLAALPLPPAVSEVCYHACRARPEDRYASVDELLQAVRRAMRQALDPSPSGPDAAKRGPWAEVSPVPTRTESVAPAQDLVLLGSLGQDDILAAGRRIRCRAMEASTDIAHAWENSGTARLRVTCLPRIGERTRVHVRGLNCFARRAGGVPTGGIDLADDAEIELVGADRSLLGSVRFHLGERGDRAWMFHLPDLRLAIASELASDALFLAFGGSPDLCLLYTQPKEAPR
jgi:serine/threonine-protein kinase